MTYISLLSKTSNLVELLIDSGTTIYEIVTAITENELTMKDIDKASKIILKRYGKKNITYHKLPVDLECEYAYTAHSQCICLHKYIRPKFYSGYDNEEGVLL